MKYHLSISHFFPFFFLAENCTNVFTSFDELRSHMKVIHSAKMYECPFCFTHVELNISGIQEHFGRLHPNLHFELFQCLFCEMGFNTIEEIRQHMSENHPSKFLFVGVRRRKNVTVDDTNIPYLYCGNSKDYSAYKLLICENHDALNSMDPKDLSPYSLQKAQKMLNVKYPIFPTYSGLIPPIVFKHTQDSDKKFEFIQYEEYKEIFSKKKNKSAKSRSNSNGSGSNSSSDISKSTGNSKKNQKNKSKHRNQPDAMEMDCQDIPMVTLHSGEKGQEPLTVTAKITAEPVPSTSKCCQNDIVTTKTAAAKPSAAPLVELTVPKVAAAPQTSTLSTVQYHCITKEIYDDLSKTDARYMSRLCMLCSKFQKIDNDTQFQAFLSHLINDHACDGASAPISDARALFDHHMRDHPKRPIFALQIEKSIDQDPQKQWIVHKICRVRYQCKLCEKYFDSHREIASHNSNCSSFDPIQVVFETMVINSTDPKQKIDLKFDFKPLVLLTTFKCKRCKQLKVFSRKSLAIQHHNQHHLNDSFEFAMKQYAYTNENVPDDDDDDDMNSLYRDLLFQCFYCKYQFESIDHENFENHACHLKHEPQFKIYKLVAIDKTIGTFEHMFHHNARKHPDKPFTPTNLFNRNECVLCENRFENINDVHSHYKLQHSKVRTELITDDLLDSMNLKDTSVGECIYIPGCCADVKRKEIYQIVCHVFSQCGRRFKCHECPTEQFRDLNHFVEHCQQLHDKTKRQIFEQLHNLKHFQALLADMHVIFPNGLYVGVENIRNTTFENKLHLAFNKQIMERIEMEKQYNGIDK